MQIQHVNNIIKEILKPVVRDNLGKWIERLERIAKRANLTPTKQVMHMLIEKVAGKLFWGRIRQLVKLRNSQIRRTHNDKNVTDTSGTVVETSRHRRVTKRKKSKKSKKNFEVSDGFTHSVSVQNAEDAEKFVTGFENLLQTNRKGAEDVAKWMYQVACNTGQVSKVNGGRTTSHFLKPHIWRMLKGFGYDGQEMKSKSIYDHTSTEKYFSILMMLLHIELPNDPEEDPENNNDDSEGDLQDSEQESAYDPQDSEEGFPEDQEDE